MYILIINICSSYQKFFIELALGTLIDFLNPFAIQALLDLFFILIDLIGACVENSLIKLFKIPNFNFIGKGA